MPILRTRIFLFRSKLFIFFCSFITNRTMIGLFSDTSFWFQIKILKKKKIREIALSTIFFRVKISGNNSIIATTISRITVQIFHFSVYT